MNALQPCANEFRFLASHWPTGVAVVTTVDAAGRMFGLTMNAVTTLSLAPMQYLLCISADSHALRALLQSGIFGINYLGAHQGALSKHFASRIPDKFAGIPYAPAASGVARLDGAIGFVDCTVNSVLPGGDHKIIIGDVRQMIVPGGEPLVHFRGQYRKLL
jgi:3-hydroxy-9,10-secoandrosta-1,3,5(10)-triene-9,17-dione monooxygenase reductase component